MNNEYLINLMQTAQVCFEEAVLIAAHAHRGQKDKQGKPYILHPMAVAAQMDTEEEMIVAVLHDALEDTSFTACDLATLGVSPEAITSILVLTRSNVSYYDYVQQIADSGDACAIKVKRADLLHNLDGLKRPIPWELRKRYEQALEQLGGFR